MFSEIFSISATSCNLVIRETYQHYVLAIEVKHIARKRCSVSTETLNWCFSLWCSSLFQ